MNKEECKLIKTIKQILGEQNTNLVCLIKYSIRGLVQDGGGGERMAFNTTFTEGRGCD